MARIGVAATAPFGADVLERLAARHDVRFLLTQPDRPAGRGRRATAPPAKHVAVRLGIPVLQPERLSDEVDLGGDPIVLVAYGQLVTAMHLERRVWWNVHPSLLPRWRGATPVERAILEGDRETGVTIIRLVEELDAGPVAAQEAFAIEPDDDAGAIYAKAAPVACELLDRVLESAPTLSEQAADGVTYAGRITAADRQLDLSRPPVELVRRVRALSPHIGARAELHGRSVTVWRASVGPDGSFELLEVQPEGGRRMEYEAWVRGLR